MVPPKNLKSISLQNGNPKITFCPFVFSYGLQTNNQSLESLETLASARFETPVCNGGQFQVSTCAMNKQKKGRRGWKGWTKSTTTQDGWADVKG